jgi:hypothetical protein
VEPYVIRQGDTLAKVAHKLGFDAMTVWNDDANKDLRTLRPDPDILFPTDVLYVPESKSPVMHALKTGQINSFTSTEPTFPIKIRFVDPPMANRSFIVAELPELTGLTTHADGSLSIDVPVTLGMLTLQFDGAKKPLVFNVGHTDPLTTVSGVFQRLQNLGHIDSDLLPDAVSVDVVRRGLLEFKAAQGRGTASPAAHVTSGAGAAAGDDATADASGLSNDGSLDDDTAQLLLSVYGF